MSQQYNKVIKRRRRIAYLKRKAEAAQAQKKASAAAAKAKPAAKPPGEPVTAAPAQS